jgi:basic membrane lipoprotein Med (substrate-binding protein (PBP1-ABC) superfamily)
LAISACGSSNSDTTTTAGDTSSTASAAKSIKVGLTLIGPRNDKAFSQSHYDGVKKAEQDVPGVKLTSTVDNVFDPQKQVDAFTNLANAGNQVVIGASGSFNQAASAVAPQFPDVRFIVSAGFPPKDIPNVTSIVPEQGVTAFIAGRLAGARTKSHKFGAIGGFEIPPTDQGLAGFKAGVLGVDPSASVNITKTGDFNDVVKAKAAANAMIANGVDQIYVFLDSGTIGVFEAAKESGKDVEVYSINHPQCGGYAHNVGTGILNNDVLVGQTLKKFADGQLEPGVTFYGVEDPKIQSFELCPGFDTPANKKLVDDMTQSINDGTLKVPAPAINPRPSYYTGK